MAFKVRLSKRAAKRLSAMRPETQRQVLDNLRILEDRPSASKQVRSGPAKGAMGYTFRVTMAPLTDRLTAVWQFNQDEKHIDVSAIVREKGEPPHTDPPPSWTESQDP